MEHDRGDRFLFNFEQNGIPLEGGYPYVQTYSFLYQFLTNIHMKKFHTKSDDKSRIQNFSKVGGRRGFQS